MKGKNRIFLALSIVITLIYFSPMIQAAEMQNMIEVEGRLVTDETESSMDQQSTESSRSKESVIPSTKPKDSTLPKLGAEIEIVYGLSGILLILIVVVSHQYIAERRKVSKLK